MGLMDKFKKILFDEEGVDVPVNEDELPDNSSRVIKNEVKEEVRNQGFRDYNALSDDEDDDIIKEVKIPKEEVETEVPVKKSFNLPIDFDIEEPIPQRSRSYEDTDEYVVNDFPSVKSTEVRRPDEMRRELRDLTRVVESPKKQEEVKDYKRIVTEKEEVQTKKPFRVTPIISPVYGILDKNYTADEVVERREQINRINNSVSKTRTYGPVSYNDQPLPKTKYGKNNLKDELVELNTTINEMINEPVSVDDGKAREIEITKTIRVSEQAPVVEETVAQPQNQEDEIIMTPNYDDYETTSIEEQYIGNNNIEDAFESTTELERINAKDAREEVVPEPSIEEIINNAENYEEEHHLEDTIETDLFNLIDSMYKKDDDLEDE